MQLLSLVIAGQLPEGNQPACRAGKLANILHHLGRGHQDHKPQVLCNKYQFQGDFLKLFSGLMQSSMWSSPRLRGRLHTLSLSLTSWRGKSSSASKRFHFCLPSRWKALLNFFEVCIHIIDISFSGSRQEEEDPQSQGGGCGWKKSCRWYLFSVNTSKSFTFWKWFLTHMFHSGLDTQDGGDIFEEEHDEDLLF